MAASSSKGIYLPSGIALRSLSRRRHSIKSSTHRLAAAIAFPVVYAARGKHQATLPRRRRGRHHPPTCICRARPSGNRYTLPAFACSRSYISRFVMLDVISSSQIFSGGLRPHRRGLAPEEARSLPRRATDAQPGADLGAGPCLCRLRHAQALF